MVKVLVKIILTIIIRCHDLLTVCNFARVICTVALIIVR
jgi:hypothetical protein